MLWNRCLIVSHWASPFLKSILVSFSGYGDLLPLPLSSFLRPFISRGCSLSTPPMLQFVASNQSTEFLASYLSALSFLYEPRPHRSSGAPGVLDLILPSSASPRNSPLKKFFSLATPGSVFSFPSLFLTVPPHSLPKANNAFPPPNPKTRF